MRSTVGLPGPASLQGPRPRPEAHRELASEEEDGVLLRVVGSRVVLPQAVAGTAPAVAATTSSQGVGVSPNVAVVADASVT